MSEPIDIDEVQDALDAIVPIAVDLCPACGQPIDHCQGHGVIGDPWGWEILNNHDQGKHDQCHAEADCT